MSDPAAAEPAQAAARLRRLVAEGVLDAELAGLLWLLGERGLPIVLAAREPSAVATLRQAMPGISGELVADSLDEVVRLAGGSSATGVPDELRDIGVVVVLRRLDGALRVAAAHYIRPLERDAGGHVQRRGPAVLAAWDEAAGGWSHFAWGVSAELAERAGMELVDFEREQQHRAAHLGADGQPGATGSA